MRKIVYIFLFVIVSMANQSYAQNLDSLWKVYNNTAQPDTNRLKAIHAIAGIYRDTNLDTSIIIIGEELKLARTTKERKYEGAALNLMGVTLMNKGNYP